MNDALIVRTLSLLPRKRLARGMGFLARLRLPGLLNRWLLRWYVRHYGVDLTVAEHPLEAYRSLEELFTRRLRPGARPLDPDPRAIVSPADGVVQAAGRVHGDRIPQGGSLNAELSALLGGGHPFEGGDYAVIYLAPPDYHRVHAPCSGRVYRWRYLPGRLFPVFPVSAERVEGLFARNERLVLWIDTRGGLEIGQVAVVLIGAFGVGRISSPFAGEGFRTNSGRPAEDVLLEPPLPVERGDELGVFHLGSTVVVLFEPGRVRLDAEAGQCVRVGERLGRVEG